LERQEQNSCQSVSYQRSVNPIDGQLRLRAEG
jgi:hypothetical protein